MDNINVGISQSVEQVQVEVLEQGDNVDVQITQNMAEVEINVTDLIEQVDVEISEVVELIEIQSWDGTRTGVTFAQDSQPIGKEKDTWYNNLTGTFHIYSGGQWKSLVVDGEHF